MSSNSRYFPARTAIVVQARCLLLVERSFLGGQVQKVLILLHLCPWAQAVAQKALSSSKWIPIPERRVRLYEYTGLNGYEHRFEVCCRQMKLNLCLDYRIIM